MHFDPTKPLPFPERQAFQNYFNLQFPSLDAKATNNKRNQILRRNAVYYISTESMRENRDPFIPYLAMNYFDRFISRNELPNTPNQDLEYRVRLLSICCLTLAWKMRTSSFEYDDFWHSRNGLKINKEDILGMELAILNGLEWEMRSVTALCFVRYYLSIAEIQTRSSFEPNITEIIIQAQGEIQFSLFNPSIMAASAILVTWPPALANESVKFMESFNDRDQQELINCCNMLREMCNEKDIPLVIFETTSCFGGESSSSQAEATLSSSNSRPHRPGKEPVVSEIEELPLPHEKKVKKMDFELKWILDKDIDLTVDPSHFLEDEDVATRSARLKTKLCACFKS